MATQEKECCSTYQVTLYNFSWKTIQHSHKVKVNVELKDPVGKWNTFFQPTMVLEGCQSSGRILSKTAINGAFTMGISFEHRSPSPEEHEEGETVTGEPVGPLPRDINLRCEVIYHAGSGEHPKFTYHELGDNPSGFVLEAQGPFVRGNTAFLFINIPDQPILHVDSA